MIISFIEIFLATLITYANILSTYVCRQALVCYPDAAILSYLNEINVVA